MMINMKFEINVTTTITGFFTVEAESPEEIKKRLDDGEYDDLIQDVADSPIDINTETEILYYPNVNKEDE